MKKRINPWAFATLCTLLLASPTLAQDEDFSLIPTWEFEIGSWFTSTDSNVRFDSNERDLGTEFDLEDTLALDDSETVLRLSAARRFGRRHQVRFRYADFSRDGTTQIPFEIRFGDIVFPVTAEVTTTWDFAAADLTYSYFFALKENTAWGVQVGVASWDFDIRVAASGGRFDRSLDSDILVEEFVPEIGLSVRHAISPKWIFKSAVSGLRADLDEESVDILNGLIRLEYRAFKNIGFAVAGDYTKIDYENSAGRFIGQIDYEISGVQFFIPIYFN